MDAGPEGGHDSLNFCLFQDNLKKQQVFEFATPDLSSSGDVCVQFAYTAFGTKAGKISVYSPKGSQTATCKEIWQSSDVSRKSWILEQFPYSVESGKWIFWRGISGGTGEEMAVDSILIRAGQCNESLEIPMTVGQASGCRPIWSKRNNFYSLGGSFRSDIQSALGCRDACLQDRLCIAVDIQWAWNLLDDTLFCRLHTDRMKLSSPLLMANTEQWELVDRCSMVYVDKSRDFPYKPLESEGCLRQWEEKQNAHYVGGTYFTVSNNTILMPPSCLAECVADLSCIAVDIGYGRSPMECWLFTAIANRSKFFYSSANMRHYYLIKRCASDKVVSSQEEDDGSGSDGGESSGSVLEKPDLPVALQPEGTPIEGLLMTALIFGRSNRLLPLLALCTMMPEQVTALKLHGGVKNYSVSDSYQINEEDADVAPRIKNEGLLSDRYNRTLFNPHVKDLRLIAVVQLATTFVTFCGYCLVVALSGHQPNLMELTTTFHAILSLFIMGFVIYERDVAIPVQLKKSPMISCEKLLSLTAMSIMISRIASSIVRKVFGFATADEMISDLKDKFLDFGLIFLLYLIRLPKLLLLIEAINGVAFWSVVLFVRFPFCDLRSEESWHGVKLMFNMCSACLLPIYCDVEPVDLIVSVEIIWLLQTVNYGLKFMEARAQFVGAAAAGPPNGPYRRPIAGLWAGFQTGLQNFG